MKGKIFIAWSGTSNLAEEVKKQLKEKDYIGIVGGESKTEKGLFVGDVILRELDQCNQAIFLIEKKCDGCVSANLMFELGYALSKFKPNKNHIFYIDISRKDTEQIPSDLDGLWAKELSSADYTDKAGLADAIVDTFLLNQKIIIPEEKMKIMNSYHSEKEKLTRYTHQPSCSEYELSQYTLFFSQAAYLYGDENEAYNTLHTLLNKLKNPIMELKTSIRYGMDHIDMLRSIIKTEDELYLDKRTSNTTISNLKDLLAEIEGTAGISDDDDDDDDDDDLTETAEPWENNEFTQWLRLFINSSLNYACILSAACPDILPEKVNLLFEESIKYGKEALLLCKDLVSDEKSEYVVRLQRAYVHRNLAIAYKKTGNTKKEVSQLKKSFNERKTILSHYEKYDINNKLHDKFELEYFIVASERLEHFSNEADYLDCKDKCEDYVRESKKHQKEKNFFVDKIEKLLHAGKSQVE